MQNVFGFSHATFDRFTKPTLYNCARCVNFLDFNLRLWDYNHTCTVGRSVGRSLVRPCTGVHCLHRLTRTDDSDTL